MTVVKQGLDLQFVRLESETLASQPFPTAYFDLGALIQQFRGMPPRLETLEQAQETLRHCDIFVAAHQKRDQREYPLVGMATLVPLRCLGRYEGIIMDLFVLPDYRRRGIGRRLINQVQAHARRLGMDRLSARVPGSPFVDASTLFIALNFTCESEEAFTLNLST